MPSYRLGLLGADSCPDNPITLQSPHSISSHRLVVYPLIVVYSFC